MMTCRQTHRDINIHFPVRLYSAPIMFIQQFRPVRKDTRSAAAGSSAIGPRQGVILIELVVMTIVISVVATVLLPMLGAARKAQAAARYEQFALMELNNVHAQLRSQPAVSRDELLRIASEMKPGAWLQQRYPTTQLTVSAAEEARLPAQPLLLPLRITLSNPEPQQTSRRRPVSTVVWLPTAAEDTP